jgi:hypothetical protein
VEGGSAQLHGALTALPWLLFPQGPLSHPPSTGGPPSYLFPVKIYLEPLPKPQGFSSSSQSGPNQNEISGSLWVEDLFIHLLPGWFRDESLGLPEECAGAADGCQGPMDAQVLSALTYSSSHPLSCCVSSVVTDVAFS